MKGWLAILSFIGGISIGALALAYLTDPLKEASLQVIVELILIGSSLLFFAQVMAFAVNNRWPAELGAISLLAGLMWIAILVFVVVRMVEVPESGVAVGVFILLHVIYNACVFIATGVNSFVDR